MMNDIAASELAREGLTISAGAGLLALCSLPLSRRASFLIGLGGAFAVNIGVWLFSVVSYYFLNGAPGSAAMALFVIPMLEEIVRAFCVYAVLAKYPRSSQGVMLFALGYAAVEPLYRILSIAWVISTTPDFQLSPSLLPLIAAPFALLVLLSVVMQFLQRVSVAAPLALVLCVALHIGHNYFAGAFVSGPNTSAILLALTGAYGACTALVATAIYRGDRNVEANLP